MIIARLKIANLRAIEAAEFHFQPGFNLVVGVNGVGKTTVLDALAACLSPVVKHVNRLRMPVKSFGEEDVRIGAGVLDVECSVRLGSAEYQYVIHKPREASAPQERKTGMPREQVHTTPEQSRFLGSVPPPMIGAEPGGRPFAILFSTNRAVPSNRAPRKGSAAGGITAAFSDAFASRELRLGEFTDWLRVQVALGGERLAAGPVLASIEDAVTRFLPGYANIRLDRERGQHLVIDHGPTSVPVRLLSDGERGILALVLDLTRRLAQANPEMSDPAADAEAVALIDEIDLHMHPKWQRQIVRNLRAAFPSCQFIATTHSPQVIGEVEHDRIQIMADGQVYSPPYSFGLDSSRVLEEVMDAEPRTQEVKELLSQISDEVGSERFGRGRELLADLSTRLGEGDPEVTRVRTLIDFMEGKD